MNILANKEYGAIQSLNKSLLNDGQFHINSNGINKALEAGEGTGSFAPLLRERGGSTADSRAVQGGVERAGVGVEQAGPGGEYPQEDPRSRSDGEGG